MKREEERPGGTARRLPAQQVDAAAVRLPPFLPPAPGTLLLRVPKLGKDGLKNGGEPLELVAPDGAVLSRAPALPKPQAGESLARVAPAAPDGDPTSFTTAAPTPGAPNSAQ